MRALQVGGVLSVLTRSVEYADRLAALSCRLQLCFQALQLGFGDKYCLITATSSLSLALTSTIPPPWNS
ncbi:hypothetical protein CDO22_24400 (plasmid) [Sinorhizobium meliloti]|nr:hypothetical protein CDO22_24400 [Sinorhizobium meliloti]